MKKMLAIATVAALLGGGSAAFAADSSAMRLDDTQMDGVTAGKNVNASQNNVAIITPITNVNVNNVAIGDGATVVSTVVINNIIYVIQTNIGGGSGKVPPGQLKKLGLSVSNSGPGSLNSGRGHG
ncbi:hypothetical protein [Caulobacter sp. 17J65-9]|uniref:hypothetical protein n=1 Tax=Caulobacter sp. 17J65-9 TaxID=2709382 RepID=UPI0013CA0AC5|nr:hypothetical protein [Caulobacter sp. 17J65-9]NEX94946.1 hypothetical protein [Caulobacter sp. 17J65-9]